MAVHTGARIGALAGTGEVFVSRTMRDLSAGSGLIFEDLGITRPRRAAGNGGILGDGGDAVSQARAESADLALIPPVRHPPIVIGDHARRQQVAGERADGHRQRPAPSSSSGLPRPALPGVRRG